jgi:hypothetical protein
MMVYSPQFAMELSTGRFRKLGDGGYNLSKHNMLKHISSFRIYLLVAVLTIIGVFFYPILKGTTTDGLNSFRIVLIQFALVSYLIYVGLAILLSKIVRRFRLSDTYIYGVHITALIVGYSLVVKFVFDLSHASLGMLG